MEASFFRLVLTCAGFSVLAVMTSCDSGNDVGENSTDQSNVDSTEAVEVETDNFEALYADKLASACNCDVDLGFDVSGEGDLIPVDILVDGETVECYSWDAHATGFDPSSGTFTLDGLGDGTEVEEGSKIEVKVNERVRTSVAKTSIYEWPDAESKEIYQLKFDGSNYEILGCYEDWVKIKVSDYSANENYEGWAKKQ